MRTAIVTWAAALAVAIGAGAFRAAAQQASDDRAGSGEAKPPFEIKKTDLVYADFENSADGKPVSARGGAVNLWGAQEMATRQSVFKGPSTVRTSKNDNNHATEFEYEFVIPNEWASVTLEIQGQPGAAENLPQDDVSEFKSLILQAYAKSIEPAYLRVEVKTTIDRNLLHTAPPMYTFKVKDGFSIYKIPLKAFAQPSWVSDNRIDPKEVLKHLTSVTVSIFCEQTCRPDKGMVIIDNLVFQK